jgi:hypothetical protein
VPGIAMPDIAMPGIAMPGIAVALNLYADKVRRETHMMHHTADSLYESDAQSAIYLACTPEDLIRVEMDAWGLGNDRAAVESEPVLPGISAIREASERACDDALEICVPLDLDRFRDVFTRAWCAGYCNRVGQRVSGPGSEIGALDKTER